LQAPRWICMQPLAIWSGHVLFDPLDTALVQAEDTILTALPLKVGLEFIPGAQIRSTIIAKNRVSGSALEGILSRMVRQYGHSSLWSRNFGGVCSSLCRGAADTARPCRFQTDLGTFGFEAMAYGMADAATRARSNDPQARRQTAPGRSGDRGNSSPPEHYVQPMRFMTL